MPEGTYHISSAVIATMPARTAAVLAEINKMEHVEVHGEGGGKIVVVIEGPNSGVLGETLIGISGMDGVLAAHMVFEQALDREETIDGDRTHAA